MPSTYEPIATTTLGSAASSITFSSISSAYTDLRLVLVCATDAYPSLRFNSDTGSNYSQTEIYGTGTNAGSYRTTSQAYIYMSPQLGGSTTLPALYTADVMSYAGSTFKTTLITSSNDQNGSGIVARDVGLYRSTTAISSLTIVALYASASFPIGTTATLYGIKAA
jgi:hypothetical protein